MPDILDKPRFIEQLKQFLGENFISEIKTTSVKIKETDKNGKGEIILDFTNKSNNNEYFLVQIEHSSNHGSAGKYSLSKLKSDGIVFCVNLNNKTIDIFLCELKTTATTQTIEKAQKQLSAANSLIDNLNLTCKFKVNKNIIIGYSNDKYDMIELRNNINKNLRKLHQVWKENKRKFPIINLFCKDSYYNFYKVKFGEKLPL